MVFIFFSIAEYTVDNSVIRPTYMLTYESASELLHMNLEEESELKILDEAAALRLRWRRQQVWHFVRSNQFLYLLSFTLGFKCSNVVRKISMDLVAFRIIWESYKFSRIWQESCGIYVRWWHGVSFYLLMLLLMRNLIKIHHSTLRGKFYAECLI